MCKHAKVVSSRSSTHNSVNSLAQMSFDVVDCVDATIDNNFQFRERLLKLKNEMSYFYLPEQFDRLLHNLKEGFLYSV